MIIYSPLDGDALTSSIQSSPRRCFLMTRLGHSVPEGVEAIRRSVSDLCETVDYEVVDAHSRVTGRDFLMKIWHLIASTPLSVGICHEEIPRSTQENIYYELGVAQALGKETLLAARGKSPAAFDRRCIPLRRVVHRSNTAGIFPLLALRSGRTANLGATRGFTTDC